MTQKFLVCIYLIIELPSASSKTDRTKEKNKSQEELDLTTPFLIIYYRQIDKNQQRYI